MKQTPGYLRETGAWLAGVAGWFVIYLALAGAAGFLVTRVFPLSPGCMPYLGRYGIIESSCRFSAVDHVWFGLLGIPRFLILLPALAIALAKESLLGWEELRSGTHWQECGAYLLASVPLGLVVWAGVRHWIKLGLRWAWIAAVMILAEICVLGLTR